MNVMTLIEGEQMKPNLLYIHNRVEEMFLIFDHDAEFTIDGRTARLQGPIGAPISAIRPPFAVPGTGLAVHRRR